MFVARRVSRRTTVGFHVPALVVAGASIWALPFLIMWWMTELTVVVTVWMVKMLVIAMVLTSIGLVALVRAIRRRTT